MIKEKKKIQFSHIFAIRVIYVYISGGRLQDQINPKSSKEITNCDGVICVMSGNFVQRGNTSIVESGQRLKWLQQVVWIQFQNYQLFTVYLVQKALLHGAVKILENLGIVDTISFGTETDDFAALNNLATIITEEPKEYVNMLKEELKQGVSFPKAREQALIKYLNDEVRYKDIL